MGECGFAKDFAVRGGRRISQKRTPRRAEEESPKGPANKCVGRKTEPVGTCWECWEQRFRNEDC